MKRTIRSAGLTAGLATVLLVSGCGSSNSTLSYSAFSNAANQVCASVNTATKALAPTSNDPNSVASALTKFEAVVAKAEAKLKALQGPSSLESARDTLLNDVSAAVSATKTAITDLKAGNKQGAVEAMRQVSTVTAQDKADGSKLGAPACAS